MAKACKRCKGTGQEPARAEASPELVAGPALATIEIPLRTFSEGNQRDGSWAQRHRRRKAQREVVLAHLVSKLGIRGGAKLLEQKPLVVIFSRLSPNPQELDQDNLASAFKAVQDATAQWFGVDDAEGGPVSWDYQQGRSKTELYGVRIAITKAVAS
jgi:hypothetical protein